MAGVEKQICSECVNGFIHDAAYAAYAIALAGVA